MRNTNLDDHCNEFIDECNDDLQKFYNLNRRLLTEDERHDPHHLLRAYTTALIQTAAMLACLTEGLEKDDMGAVAKFTYQSLCDETRRRKDAQPNDE